MPEDYEKFGMFETVDSGLLFVFVHKSKNDISQSTLEPEWKIYGSILRKDSNQLDRFLIYQTSVQQLINPCVKCYN